MSSYWPETESLDIPHLDARGIRLRVGMVTGQSRWSSTSVKGSIGGGMYNGTGSVHGSVSSTVTNHQRVFVHFPEDSSEVALEWDDWNFDIREGHTLILACGPTDDRACLAYNADTRQPGPKNSLKIGEIATSYARTFALDLWFWRLIAIGMVVAAGALIFGIFHGMFPYAHEAVKGGLVLQVASVAGCSSPGRCRDGPGACIGVGWVGDCARPCFPRWSGRRVACRDRHS